MRNRTIIAALLALALGIPAVATAQQPRDTASDRHEVRRDRRSDRRDVRRDRRDLHQDRHDTTRTNPQRIGV